MNDNEFQKLMLEIGATWIINTHNRRSAYFTAMQAMLDAGMEITPQGDDDWDATLDEFLGLRER